MWKTIQRVEIKDGWGISSLDLIWEYGMIDESEIRGLACNLVIIDEAVEKLYQLTKNDGRWDILSDAYAMLEKSFLEKQSETESSRISPEELSGTVKERLCD